MTDLAAVIPLRSRAKPGAHAPVGAKIPEPVTLYCLTVIAFLLHVNKDGQCPQCREAWPCKHVRLAYRLREGF